MVLLDTIRALKQLRGQGQSEELQLQPLGTPFGATVVSKWLDFSHQVAAVK